jgi:hypothetical protein
MSISGVCRGPFTLKALFLNPPHSALRDTESLGNPPASHHSVNARVLRFDHRLEQLHAALYGHLARFVSLGQVFLFRLPVPTLPTSPARLTRRPLFALLVSTHNPTAGVEPAWKRQRRLQDHATTAPDRLLTGWHFVRLRRAS